MKILTLEEWADWNAEALNTWFTMMLVASCARACLVLLIYSIFALVFLAFGSTILAEAVDGIIVLTAVFESIVLFSTFTTKRKALYIQHLMLGGKYEDV